MQISRRVLLACAVTILLLPAILQADTAAQEKAREALTRKMQELNSGAGSSPATAVPSTSAQPSRPAQPPASSIPVQRPAAATRSVGPATSANQQKALDALRQHMEGSVAPAGSTVATTPAAPNTSTSPAPTTQPPTQPDSRPGTISPAPASTPAATAANQQKALEALRQAMGSAPAQTQPGATPSATAGQTSGLQSAAGFQDVPQAGGDANVEKAIQALRQKTQELEQQERERQQALSRPQPKPQPAMTQTPPDQGSKPEPKPAQARSGNQAQEGWTPLQGPPTGLPAEKEEKLRVLLEDYRADRLTPAQYHAERAKILAAP